MTLALLLFLAMLGYILWDARGQIAGLFAGLWRKLRGAPTEAGRQTTKPGSTPVGTGLDSPKD